MTSFQGRVVYAPLAGYTDFVFRKLVRSFFSGLIFTEMVKMEALVRSDPETLQMLAFSSDMHPIGCQICGANPEIAGRAARIVEDMGFDIIDLNCGCPVDKVTRDGSGSAMLKDPQRIYDVLRAMISSVRIPVSLKIRAGWDEKHLVHKEVARMAEDLGIHAICLHARTQKQGYSGTANWHWIREIKECTQRIHVYGNGDVFTPEDGVRMIQETGCDKILIARGALKEPWLGREIENALNHEPIHIFSDQEKLEVLQDHFKLLCHHFPKKKVLLDMRRIASSYLPKHTMLRRALVEASFEEIHHIIFP